MSEPTTEPTDAPVPNVTPDEGVQNRTPEPVQPQDETAHGGEQSDTEQDDQLPSRKYRNRAQAAEAARDEIAAERDQLAERLTLMQRAEAERIAGRRLGRGVDLWAGGVDIGSLIGDDGNLSVELIDQAVDGVLQAHPHWRQPGAPPASTVTANGRIGDGKQPSSFADAFKPRTA